MTLRIFVLVLVLFASVQFVKAQTPTSEIIMDANESSAGMVANPGKYLFLRVAKSGTVEFQRYEMNDDGRRLITDRYELDKSILADFEAFISSDQVQSIKSEFEPDSPVLDHVIGLDITLNILSRRKTIKLTNFPLASRVHAINIHQACLN